MKQKSTYKNLVLNNSIEENLAILDQIHFDISNNLVELNFEIKDLNKKLIPRLKFYLDLQTKFLGKILKSAESKMKEVIKSMEKTAENLLNKRDRRAIEKARKLLS